MLTLFIFILLLIACAAIVLLLIKIEQIKIELLQWVDVTNILKRDLKSQIDMADRNAVFLIQRLKDRLFMVDLLLNRLIRPVIIKNLVKDSCEFKSNSKKGD
jgi:hypothetical protein